MDNSLLIAVTTGLIAMVGWGTADFLAKKTIDQIGDIATLFWGQLLGIAPLLFIYLLNPDIGHLSHFDPLFLVLMGIFSAVSYLPLYTAFGKGQVSIISPVFASYSVMVVVLAAIFLHASISSQQKLAIAVVVAGILLASTDLKELRQAVKGKAKSLKGLPEALAAMTSYSVWLVLLDGFLNGRSWVFPLLVIRSFAAFTLLVYATYTKKKLTVDSRSLWPYLAAIGLFDVAAFAAVSYGYSHTSHIGIVTVLSATFSIPTIILAYIFLKERIKLAQVVAALLILVGVALVSLS